MTVKVDLGPVQSVTCPSLDMSTSDPRNPETKKGVKRMDGWKFTCMYSENKFT